MRYLITGSTGLVGQEIINQLSKTNSKIICLIHRSKNLVKNKNVEFINGDISDKNSIENICRNVDIIIHCAALINATSLDKYLKVNYLGTRNLVSEAIKHKVSKFIYISSWATNAFGGYYSLTKLLSEQVVKKHPNFLIIKPADIYSKTKSHLKNYISSFKKLPIVPVIGKGDYLISPLFVEDLIKAIFHLKNSENLITTITGPKVYTFNQFNNILCKHYKMQKPFIYLPLKIAKLIFSEERILRLSADKNIYNRFTFKNKPLTFEKALEDSLFD